MTKTTMTPLRFCGSLPSFGCKGSPHCVASHNSLAWCVVATWHNEAQMGEPLHLRSKFLVALRIQVGRSICFVPWLRLKKKKTELPNTSDSFHHSIVIPSWWPPCRQTSWKTPLEPPRRLKMGWVQPTKKDLVLVETDSKTNGTLNKQLEWSCRWHEMGMNLSSITVSVYYLCIYIYTYKHYTHIYIIIDIHPYSVYNLSMPENQHLIFSPTHQTISVPKLGWWTTASPASSQGQDCLGRLPATQW